MNARAAQTVYDKAEAEFLIMFEDMVGDFLHWFGRLTDLERLLGLCAFILTLFVLVVVKSSSGSSEPGKARSFVGSFTLVVAFSFLVGLLIDSEFDPRHFLPSNIF